MAGVFLVIGALGVLVLLISLFVGELGDLGLGDVDADGPFSVPALAALLGGVGFGGAAAVSLLPDDLPDAGTALLALAAGLVVAVPLAWGAVRLSRALRDMPTQETLTRNHLVGAQGVVVSAVPAAGYGEVRLALAGQHLKVTARSEAALPTGTPRGQAEAEALDARSDAFAKYGEAAILEMLVKVLPDVVSAAAAPLSGVDKMTVISTDGAGALGKSVASNVAQGLQLSGDLTGIDVGALLRRLSGSAASTVDGVTRVPISSDGDGAAHNGQA